jgi:hypothetical protein
MNNHINKVHKTKKFSYIKGAWFCTFSSYAQILNIFYFAVWGQIKNI